MSNFSDGHIPLHFPLPWDWGKSYSYFWISYITVLVIGVITNATTFTFLRLGQRIHHMTSGIVVQYLIGEDGLSALTCLIQCCINLHVRRLLGERPACMAEAWQVIFFITITSYSLCLIAFVVQRAVTGGFRSKTSGMVMDREELSRFTFRVHLIIWPVGALISTGACIWPGYSRLTVSGTYCLPAFDDPWVSTFFFGLVVFPSILFLAVQYIGIFIYVQKAKKSYSTQKSSDKNPPWFHQLKLARKLGILVIAYYIFYAPFMSSAIYEWVTNKFSPSWLDCFGGVMVHFSSAVNPILYVWMNKQAQVVIFSFFCLRARVPSSAPTSFPLVPTTSNSENTNAPPAS